MLNLIITKERYFATRVLSTFPSFTYATISIKGLCFQFFFLFFSTKKLTEKCPGQLFSRQECSHDHARVSLALLNFDY